jgi:hypothetical protein
MPLNAQGYFNALRSYPDIDGLSLDAPDNTNVECIN